MAQGMELGIELTGWEQVAANWERAPELFSQELKTWAETTAMHLTDEIKALTPKDTGALQDSIKPIEIDVGPLGVNELIGTALNYAVPVELGSKPHDITPKNGKALSFIFNGVQVFVKKVHHPGTTGYFMFQQALDANRAQIQDSFSATVDGVLTRLAGNA
jgi:hypothetical protein